MTGPDISGKTCEDCKYCILEKGGWLFPDKYYCTYGWSKKEINPKNPACDKFQPR